MGNVVFLNTCSEESLRTMTGIIRSGIHDKSCLVYFPSRNHRIGKKVDTLRTCAPGWSTSPLDLSDVESIVEHLEVDSELRDLTILLLDGDVPQFANAYVQQIGVLADITQNDSHAIHVGGAAVAVASFRESCWYQLSNEHIDAFA